MSNSHKISQKDAQKIALYAQSITGSNINSLAAIQQLGYVQIDTISVTERAHNHVFFSRNDNFKKEEINQLMNKQLIFEYWSHAAAYLPMENFRFSLYRKEQYKNGDQHWFPRDKKIDRYVLDKIKAEGPLQSKDFDHPKNKNQEWYEWKPAKIALTNLFMDGSLMVKERVGFQKVFDLTERVIPEDVNTILPSSEEYYLHLITNTLKSHGFASLSEISYLRKGSKSFLKKLLQELVSHHQITPLRIEGNNVQYYTNQDTLDGIDTLKNSKSIHILSPFDNLVIQRKRVKEIFDFDYQIECYVPEKKRKYGYYALPILFGNSFVGRMDAKADRKTKLFTVKGIWFEKEFKPSNEFYTKFTEQLTLYSEFCGCEKVKIDKVFPALFKKELSPFI